MSYAWCFNIGSYFFSYASSLFSSFSWYFVFFFQNFITNFSSMKHLQMSFYEKGEVRLIFSVLQHFFVANPVMIFSALYAPGSSLRRECVDRRGRPKTWKKKLLQSKGFSSWLRNLRKNKGPSCEWKVLVCCRQRRIGKNKYVIK